MKRFVPTAIIAAGALAAGGIAIAASGSDGGDDSSPAATSSVSGSAPESTRMGSATVNLTDVEGFGAVLTDADGRTLYASDEEAADPDVLCVDACEQFWAPLDITTDAPTAGDGVTDLDVAERPDGSQQVTYEGRRLYTFTQEDPGQATGDGFSDDFGGQQFTWHVVVADTPGSSV